MKQPIVSIPPFISTQQLLRHLILCIIFYRHRVATLYLTNPMLLWELRWNYVSSTHFFASICLYFDISVHTDILTIWLQSVLVTINLWSGWKCKIIIWSLYWVCCSCKNKVFQLLKIGGFTCTSPSWFSVTSYSSQCCWTRMASQMIECYQFRCHFTEPQKS